MHTKSVAIGTFIWVGVLWGMKCWVQVLLSSEMWQISNDGTAVSCGKGVEQKAADVLECKCINQITFLSWEYACFLLEVPRNLLKKECQAKNKHSSLLLKVFGNFIFSVLLPSCLPRFIILITYLFLLQFASKYK